MQEAIPIGQGGMLAVLGTKAEDISNFILPLLINLSQMNIDILKIIEEKKVVCIVSKVVLYSKEVSNEYYTGHTTINLSEVNNLYTLEDFHRWSLNIFFKLTKELEVYNSFEKMSFTVQVKEITHISYEL